MRIGIDCDGVLRDFIGSVQDTIKKYHPELADQLKTPTDWDWETWIPFWTEEETEKFVFEDHVEEIFYTADAYDEALEDWPVLMEWAKNQGHELVLVSAQRDDCIDITNESGFSAKGCAHIEGAGSGDTNEYNRSAYFWTSTSSEGTWQMLYFYLGNTCHLITNLS